MLFVTVLYSVYELLRESLASAKLAPPFLVSKNVVTLNSILTKNNALSKKINIFLLKELFHIPPTENYSLPNCFTTVSAYILLFYIGIINTISLLKRVTHATSNKECTYKK